MKTHTWNELKDRHFSATEQSAIRNDAIAELGRLSLRELRKSRNLTQAALATSIGCTQSAVSRMERRADMHVSTLRNYVEATGGVLRIVAQFEDGAVEISQVTETRHHRAESTSP